MMRIALFFIVTVTAGLAACDDAPQSGQARDAVLVPDAIPLPDGASSGAVDGRPDEGATTSDGVPFGDVGADSAPGREDTYPPFEDGTPDTSNPDSVPPDTSDPDASPVDTAAPADAISDTPDADDTNAPDDTRAPDDMDAPDAGPDASEPRGPEVTYALSEPRRLFFSNNPEQLLTTELGDSDLMDATLLRVTAIGPSRSFFEHLNKSGRTIGFGVQVYNPGPGQATVTVRGVGFTVGISGGIPFADAFNGVGSAPAKTLAAGQSTWIFRRDDSVPNGSFFSGVVDFDVNAPVTVNHIAYDDFAKLDGATAERDYVQRIEPDGTHEARMYKGVATASEATFAPTFAFSTLTPSGPLTVINRRFDLVGQTYGPPLTEDAWTSHIGPSQNAAATMSDMVSFLFRTWRFDPLVKSDGEGRYPNLGNWGVVYRLRAKLRNEGNLSRKVTWRLVASPGAGAGLAKTSGGAWTSHQLAAGASLNLGTVTVPAFGEVVLEGAMVLGGPSGGALKQSLVLE
jgi:hypothetical protein